MKSTEGAGLIGDEALDFLAILSLPVILHFFGVFRCFPAFSCVFRRESVFRSF